MERFEEIGRQDDRVLAIYMNGSRTNPNAPKDIFQDYDIVFVVEETEPFINDPSWCHQFGDVLYMQYPDESPFYPSDKHNSYGWLMQFKDGTRLDLSVKRLDYAIENIKEDRLCKILVDKKGVLPAMPPSTDADFWVKKPSMEEYAACANEFWWCSNNVAKGMWRGEMTYVQDMTNMIVRKQLEMMLSFQIGIENDFKVSIGKSGKYMSRYLSKEEWQSYQDTFFTCDEESAWEAIDGMCKMFLTCSEKVAKALDYPFNEQEAHAAYGYLLHVRELPKDAKSVY